jgi:hypothetical protein
MPIDEYGAGNGKLLAKDLFNRAGVTQADVDTVQIYDHFTGFGANDTGEFCFLRTW